MKIDASGMTFDLLNRAVRASQDKTCEISGCLGQRFIAAGESEKEISLYGTPGNALAAYLNGATVQVYGNAQDAVGDTMNDGAVYVHGNVGDAAGYAMRGGKIFVKGNAGYRAGIHMKEYQNKVPVLIIGGSAGSFLGEYQAGGLIVVLGLESERPIVGNFPCTGMHGGKMLLRSNGDGITFPSNVQAQAASEVDLAPFKPLLESYCAHFGYDYRQVTDAPFIIITPDSKNPYKQMYVQN